MCYILYPFELTVVARGMTREQLANIVDYDIRHLQAIENEGQYPSFQLFTQLGYPHTDDWFYLS